MSTPVNRLLSALREHGFQPRKSGSGWNCKCPAHDDQSPSLSIHAGDDGRALVKCHAGCPFDRVCDAIGLRPADLFDTHPNTNGQVPKPRRRGDGATPKPAKGEGSVAVTTSQRTAAIDAGLGDGDGNCKAFPSARDAIADLELQLGPRSASWTYTNASCEPVGLVVRWDRADGKIIRPVSKKADGSGWCIAGMPTPRPLNGLSELLATPAASRVYVTEGEKAADAARSLGLLATTSPHGSNSASKADWSPVAAREVVILPDNDDAGEKYAADVARLATAAGAKSVRIVRLVQLWSEMPKGGDMADLLEHRGGDVDRIRAELETLIDKNIATTPKRVPINGAPVIVCLADVEPREVSWLWEGRIPRGRLSLLAGRPGEGKSMATMDWAARVTTGRAWPDGLPCARGSVVLVAGEDDPHDTIRPRLDAHGADVTRVHLLQSVVRIGSNGAESQAVFTLADLPALESTLAQMADCALVIVDPIGSFIGSGVDAHRDNEVRGVLGPLAALAQRSGAAVLMVAHQRKGAASHADDLVLGSRAFTGIARSVLHLLIDPENEGRRLLLPGKMNLARPAAGLAFTIGGNPPRVEWEPDPVAMTADGMLAAKASANVEQRTARDDAQDWLREFLRNGPKSAREVLNESDAAGFSKRTIERAKVAARVRARKETFGGGWVWELGELCQVRQSEAEDCQSPGSGNLGQKPDESCENLPKIATPKGLAIFDGRGGSLRDAEGGDNWSKR